MCMCSGVWVGVYEWGVCVGVCVGGGGRGGGAGSVDVCGREVIMCTCLSFQSTLEKES